jgi:hypothetical protein
MGDNNLTDETGQYGYVTHSTQRPRIHHSSQARASLRREVIHQLGRLKQEKLNLHRTTNELAIQVETLRIEADNIGTLVFGLLEEDRAALVVVHNFFLDLLAWKEAKLATVEQNIVELKDMWYTYLCSIPN